MSTDTTFSDDHIITQADAELLVSRRACKAGAQRIVGLTVKQACEANPRDAIQYAASLLTPERLDWCAEKHVWSALACAASLLTPECLDWCAKAKPRTALQYAAPQLTPERLDWCAEKQPCAALQYAAPLLTPKRLDWCTSAATQYDPQQIA